MKNRQDQTVAVGWSGLGTRMNKKQNFGTMGSGSDCLGNWIENNQVRLGVEVHQRDDHIQGNVDRAGGRGSYSSCIISVKSLSHLGQTSPPPSRYQSFSQAWQNTTSLDPVASRCRLCSLGWSVIMSRSSWDAAGANSSSSRGIADRDVSSK